MSPIIFWRFRKWLRVGRTENSSTGVEGGCKLYAESEFHFERESYKLSASQIVGIFACVYVVDGKNAGVEE